MNRATLLHLIKRREEHAVATRSAEALQLAYARHNGLTHEAPSPEFERAYHQWLDATPVAVARLMKGPFAQEILKDRLDLEPDQRPSLKRSKARIKEKERGM